MKELSINYHQKLLQYMNKTWQEGIFPEHWNNATICPIKKPKKDERNPLNYRGIAL